MQHKAFGPGPEGGDGVSAKSNQQKSQRGASMLRLDRRLSPMISWKTLECVYPRYPEVGELALSEAERDRWIDLRPYIDSAPYTINEHASVQVRLNFSFAG